MLPLMDEDTNKQIKRTKHRFTDFDAAFVVKGDLTDNKSMSSVQVSGREQSINTSRYSRRNIDHDEVLLTWDETATSVLTKEEQ